jgi:hypothetical protein
MKIFVSIFIAIAVSVYFFYVLMPLGECPRHYDGNKTNLFLFTYRSHHPIFSPQETAQYIASFPMWENRFGGALIAGAMWDVAWPYLGILWHSGSAYFPGFEIVFALYNALWIFATFILFIKFTDNPLFYIFGVTAGLLYNFGQQSGAWICTWDMPALFWFTWATFLSFNRRWLGLFMVIIAGAFFKETLCVMALPFLFADWPAKRRISTFGSVVFICYAIRVITDGLFHVHAHTFAGSHDSDFSHNAHTFFQVNSCLFNNCGTMLLLFLLPVRGDLKCVSFVFLLAQFTFGHFDEPREYYELLPIGLIGLDNLFKPAKPIEPEQLMKGIGDYD